MYLEYFGIFFLGMIFGAFVVTVAILIKQERGSKEETPKPGKVKKQTMFKPSSEDSGKVINYQQVMEDWLYGVKEEDE